MFGSQKRAGFRFPFSYDKMKAAQKEGGSAFMLDPIVPAV